MRSSLFASIGFIFIATLIAPMAKAAGNVLLPSSTNDGSSAAPNLGLGVPPNPQNDATTPAPPSAAGVSTDPAPAAQTQMVPMAPSPPSNPKMSVPDVKAADILTRLNPVIPAKLPPGTMPTTIIHQPDNSAIYAQASKDLPSSLTIAVGGQSIFGSKDIEQISKKLGLSRDQINSSCILAVRGFMETDKSGYVLDGGLSPQLSVRYAGTIKSFMMAANAFCLASSLPNGSGFITEMGGRYIISLEPIKCAPPTRQATTLTITYNGSGTSQCSYE